MCTPLPPQRATPIGIKKTQHPSSTNQKRQEISVAQPSGYSVLDPTDPVSVALFTNLIDD